MWYALDPKTYEVIDEDESLAELDKRIEEKGLGQKVAYSKQKLFKI